MAAHAECLFYGADPYEADFKNMAKVKVLDVHPVKPWVVTADEKDRVTVWDYARKEVIKTFTPQELQEQQRGLRDVQKAVLKPAEDQGGAFGAQHLPSRLDVPLRDIRGVKFYDPDVLWWSCRCQVSRASATSRAPEFIIVLTATKLLLINPVTLECRHVSAEQLNGAAPTCMEVMSGAWIAIGCADGCVRLWDWRKWTLVTVLRGHKDKGDVTHLVNTHLHSSWEPSDSPLTKGAQPGDGGEDSGCMRFVSVGVDGQVLMWEAPFKDAEIEGGTHTCQLDGLVKGDQVHEVAVNSGTGVLAVLVGGRRRSGQGDMRVVAWDLSMTVGGKVGGPSCSAGAQYRVGRSLGLTSLGCVDHPRFPPSSMVACSKDSLLHFLAPAEVSTPPHEPQDVGGGAGGGGGGGGEPQPQHQQGGGWGVEEPGFLTLLETLDLHDLVPGLPGRDRKLVKVYAVRQHPLNRRLLLCGSRVGIFVLSVSPPHEEEEGAGGSRGRLRGRLRGQGRGQGRGRGLGQGRGQGGACCYYAGYSSLPWGEGGVLSGEPGGALTWRSVLLASSSEGGGAGATTRERKNFFPQQEGGSWSNTNTKAGRPAPVPHCGGGEDKSSSRPRFGPPEEIVGAEGGGHAVQGLGSASAGPGPGDPDTTAARQAGAHQRRAVAGRGLLSSGTKILMDPSGRFAAVIDSQAQIYRVFSLDSSAAESSKAEGGNSARVRATEVCEGACGDLAWVGDGQTLAVLDRVKEGITHEEAGADSLTLRAIGAGGVSNLGTYHLPGAAVALFGGLLLGVRLMRGKISFAGGSSGLDGAAEPVRHSAKMELASPQSVSPASTFSENPGDGLPWKKLDDPPGPMQLFRVAAAADGEAGGTTLMPIGPLLPEVYVVAWDLPSRRCALCCKNRVYIYCVGASNTLTFQASVGCGPPGDDAVTSMCWSQGTLYFCTPCAIYAVFCRGEAAERVILASHAAAADPIASLALSAAETVGGATFLRGGGTRPWVRCRPPGFLQVLGTLRGDLLLCGPRDPYLLRLDQPFLRLGMLACADQPARAVRWASAMPEEERDEVALLLDRLGFPAEAVRLHGVSPGLVLDLCIKNRIVDPVKEMAVAGIASFGEDDEGCVQDGLQSLPTVCRAGLFLKQQGCARELSMLIKECARVNLHEEADLLANLAGNSGMSKNLGLVSTGTI